MSQSKSKTKREPNAMKVTCPVCGARRDERCSFHPREKRGPQGQHHVRLAKAHSIAYQRRKASRKGIKAAKRAKAKKWEGVAIRYECPVCGGDHKRAEHERATNPTDFISQALR